MKNLHQGFIAPLLLALIALLILGGGAYWYTQNKQANQSTGTNSGVNFSPTLGAKFTLSVGQTATDGAGGITVRLDSITSGQYPFANVRVVSASSTWETSHAEVAKTWRLTPDLYTASQGSRLLWSAKFGNSVWPDTNSSTDVITLTITSIDMSAQTVTFEVGTTPNPADRG